MLLFISYLLESVETTQSLEISQALKIYLSRLESSPQINLYQKLAVHGNFFLSASDKYYDYYELSNYQNNNYDLHLLYITFAPAFIYSVYYQTRIQLRKSFTTKTTIG